MKYLLALLLLTTPAYADEPYKSCVVERISDGDTFRCVMSDQWGPNKSKAMRVFGIDTPESLSRRKGTFKDQGAMCDKEQRLGIIAKAQIKKMVPVGSVIQVQWVRPACNKSGQDGYGRPLVNVKLSNGKDWGTEMIRMGLAMDYARDCNLTKPDWCK